MSFSVRNIGIIVAIIAASIAFFAMTVAVSHPAGKPVPVHAGGSPTPSPQPTDGWQWE